MAPLADGVPEAPAPPASTDNQTPEDILAGLETPEPPAATAAVPPLDDEFLKRLESIDPNALPEALRRKIELPFKQDHTKKTQDLARERESVAAERQRIDATVTRLAETVEKLAARGGAETTVTPDEREILKQKIAEGDADAIKEYVDKILAEKVDNDPRMIHMTQKEALAEAERYMPEIGKYESSVADALRSDPLLLRMATENRFAYAPRVLAGLAFQAGYRDLKAYVEKEPERQKEYGRKVLEAYKQKVRGAPSITTRAATTPTGTTQEVTEKSLREIMAEEWENPAHRQ